MPDDVKQLKITDKEYPDILKEINDPPESMYYRGNLDALNYSVGVAVVGTRRCSDYGKQATETITAGLAKAGLTIISGMARGVDTYGHEAALEYGAPTVAILGGGISNESIYPKRNLKLAHKIIESGGVVMSEYEPTMPSLPHQFPERNRIVAGLSQGVLVVEAPLKSGSMITGRLALDYNRDVYAVPGSIYSRISEGCNELIKKGAKCVTKAEDILEDLNLNYELDLGDVSKNTTELDKNQKAVYEVIAESPDALHSDTLIEKTKLETETVAEIITWLVLEDYIKETEPGYYVAI